MSGTQNRKVKDYEPNYYGKNFTHAQRKGVLTYYEINFIPIVDTCVINIIVVLTPPPPPLKGICNISTMSATKKLQKNLGNKPVSPRGGS